MRVFPDTNILLDVLLNRPGLAEASGEAIQRCGDSGAELFVAWHGLATAYYLLKRGRTKQETLQEVDRILAWARIAAIGDGEARRARHLGLPDFEDALQSVPAEACCASWIITSDERGFKGGGVPVISLEEFVERFPASPA